jgi:hypothetical protein
MTCHSYRLASLEPDGLGASFRAESAGSDPLAGDPGTAPAEAWWEAWGWEVAQAQVVAPAVVGSGSCSLICILMHD